MEKVNTILAALDLEPGADAVLARAVQLANAHTAVLVVLHVIEAESLSQAACDMEIGESELRARLERQALAAIGSQLALHQHAPQAEVRVEFGVPYAAITRMARDQHADVVVIGSGKARSFKEKVLGSTADRIVRTAPASVLVVKKQTPAPYRHIAVAVDFSPQSITAVKEAQRLAPDAALQLIHAIDISMTFQQAMLRAGTPPHEMDKYRAARIGKARDDLSAVAREAAGDATILIRVLDGEPAPALVRLSRSRRIDLLAMGPHGRGVVLEALLGGVARRVLGEAACDVLIAHGGDCQQDK